MVLIGSQPESGVVADTVWCPTDLVKGIKMQVSVSIKGIATTVKALTYTFPKKGNAPAGYTLTVGGKLTDTAQTGGGKYPQYTYFKHEGASYYLPKNVIPDTSTDIVIIPPEPKAVAAPKPVAAPTEPAERNPEHAGVDMEPAKDSKLDKPKGNKRK